MAMTLLQRLREPALRRAHGGGVLLRALTDVAERRVLDVEFKTDLPEELRLEAIVRGARGERFDVLAVLVKEGRAVVATGRCDCGEEATCRHILAVLLATRAAGRRVA